MDVPPTLRTTVPPVPFIVVPLPVTPATAAVDYGDDVGRYLRTQQLGSLPQLTVNAFRWGYALHVVANLVPVPPEVSRVRACRLPRALLQHALHYVPRGPVPPTRHCTGLYLDITPTACYATCRFLYLTL